MNEGADLDDTCDLNLYYFTIDTKMFIYYSVPNLVAC